MLDLEINREVVLLLEMTSGKNLDQLYRIEYMYHNMNRTNTTVMYFKRH